MKRGDAVLGKLWAGAGNWGALEKPEAKPRRLSQLFRADGKRWAIHFALVILKRNDKAARILCQQRAQMGQVFAPRFWRQRNQRGTVVKKRVGGADPELEKISVADLNVGSLVAHLIVQPVLMGCFPPFRVEIGNCQGAELYSGDAVASVGQPAHVQAFSAQGNEHRIRPVLGHARPEI